MFDKKYKNAMDNVKIDNETYEKILDKIILKEELKDRKNPAIPWRVAFACVACIAIVFGIIFVPHNNSKPSISSNKNAPTTLKVSKSYDEIYKLLMPEDESGLFDGIKKKVKKKVNVTNEIYEDNIEYVVEESAQDFDDGAKPGGAASQNTSANAGATESESTNAPASDKNATEREDFSTTTEQVEGVSEADIVKTDGEYIYYLLDNQLFIYKADGQNSNLVSKTTLENSGEKYNIYSDMFLKDNRLVLIQTDPYEEAVKITIYDITNHEKPKVIATSCQQGYYNSSRMVGDYVYLISNCHINTSQIVKDDPATFVPTTETNGICEPVPADSIYRYEQESYTNQYTVIGAFNYKDGVLSDTASLLGGTDQVYCSQGNIILTNHYYNHMEQSGTYSRINNKVSRLEISKGQIEYKATGEINGGLENQFFIDEHNGYFRFVTTVTMATLTNQKFDNSETVVSYELNEQYAKLTVLDSELKKVGEITDLAKGERVYSVRFMGDIAYFVTFRQTDPLFSADLSDPANPKILGELKIPGFSEYMYPYGEGLLLGFGMDADESTGRTKDLKLSMFNITDPANVTEQDKTIIDGYNYSPALDNHKSMLVHSAKNIIGFVAYDNYGGIRYMIYRHNNNAFERVATLELPYDTKDDVYKYYDVIRGLFIDNNFYLVSDKGLQVFDMDTFLQISIIQS